MTTTPATPTESDGTDPVDADRTPPDPGDDERLPMDRVNQLIARETRKAAKKAQAELLETLGAKDADELQTVLKSAREREDAERSELERAQARAQETEGRAAELERELETERLRGRITTALSSRADDDGNAAPVRPERLAVAVDLALAHAVTLDDEEAVTGGVEHVVGISPEWFGAQDAVGEVDSKNGRTPSVRARGPADKKPGPKSPAARGAEAAGKFGGGFIPPIKRD